MNISGFTNHRDLFQCSVTEHYCTTDTHYKQKGELGFLVHSAPSALSAVPALVCWGHIRNCIAAPENPWKVTASPFFLGTILSFSVVRGSLELTASLLSSAGANVCVSSTCLVPESLILHCHLFFFIFQDTVFHKRYLHEQHSSINHLPLTGFKLSPEKKISNFPFATHCQN